MDFFRKRILPVLIVIAVLFIWIHSCMPADMSTAESGFIMDLIKPFLELFTGEGNVTPHLVRKLAHFTEFAGLGFLVGLHSGFGLIWPFCGLAVAFVDETIQLFVEGRAGMVQDMWIDISGYMLGWIVSSVLVILITKAIKGKREESKNGS